SGHPGRAGGGGTDGRGDDLGRVLAGGLPAARPDQRHRRHLTCVRAWNDFLLPLVILSDPDAATIQLAQYVFQGQFSADYTLAFASYLMAMAPLLIVYVVAQRWVISGVTRGAIK